MIDTFITVTKSLKINKLIRVSSKHLNSNLKRKLLLVKALS